MHTHTLHSSHARTAAPWSLCSASAWRWGAAADQAAQRAQIGFAGFQCSVLCSSLILWSQVVLTDSAGAKADVYLFGGVCTSWVPAGGKDVLFVRPDAVFNKSKPISGGIPHCFPQFGPGAMQLHGFARNLDWALTSTTGGAAPSVELTLVDTAATREMWPTAFKATQTITLASGKLTATLTVTNTDTKPFSFTSSFHTYFAVSDLSAVAVEGLQGLKMLDRMAQPAVEGTAAGAVNIKSPVDSVYYKAPAQLMLKTGGGKAVAIKAGGWPDAVVWNPWTAMEACYKDFVCVENAAVGQPITVTPGASWSGSMELTAH